MHFNISKSIVHIALLALFLTSGDAFAQRYNAAKVLEAFGLLGRWAQERCDLPPSHFHEWVRFIAKADGSVEYFNYFAPDKAVRALLQHAERIAPDRIVVRGWVGNPERAYEGQF